jgi:hypothetical protein
MKYIHFTNSSSIYQPNARAEDGMEQNPQNSFWENVLIPAGLVFVVFLTMLGTMLFHH